MGTDTPGPPNRLLARWLIHAVLAALCVLALSSMNVSPRSTLKSGCSLRMLEKVPDVFMLCPSEVIVNANVSPAALAVRRLCSVRAVHVDPLSVLYCSR